MSNGTVVLARGHTHTEVSVLPGTRIANIIGNFIRARLTEYSGVFNKRTLRTDWTIVAKYCRFDASTGLLSIPTNFTDQLKADLELEGVQVIENRLRDYPLRKIDLKMKEFLPDGTPLKDRPWQVDLIAKCSDPTPGMKGLALQTGKGKTYSAIKAICNLGYAALVIAPGLADQWIESFREFTDDPDQVYKLQEFKSLSMLMQSDWKPKVFVASIQTLQAYAKGKDNYKVLPYNFKQFVEHYGIGVKVVDECHLNFHAVTKMDMLINVPYNLYCSATFGQTNKYANAIFNVVFPPEIRYGADKYDKYVTIHFYNYSGEVLEEKCVRMRGYSHMRYENELLKNKSRFHNHYDTLIDPIINIYFTPVFKPGKKMLILCSTIEFISAVANDIRSHHPEFKVKEYVGNATKDELKEADVIVATVGKAATGLDIKGLAVMYNTISVRSSIITAQSLGRLRKVEGEELIYVDRCDTNLGSHVRHAQSRMIELKSMALKFIIHNGIADPGKTLVDRSQKAS